MRQVAIYALCEFPDLRAVRYVGQSIEPKRRLYGHLHAQHEHNHRRNWISAVLASGAAIGCLIIEWVAPDQADAAERFWVSELSRQGYRLTNSSLLAGPAPEYEPSTTFEPLASKLLLTMPYRSALEWNRGSAKHEDGIQAYLRELEAHGRAMVQAGADKKAMLDELFWLGMDALITGRITLRDMDALREQGRQVGKPAQEHLAPTT